MPGLTVDTKKTTNHCVLLCSRVFFHDIKLQYFILFYLYFMLTGSMSGINK